MAALVRGMALRVSEGVTGQGMALRVSLQVRGMALRV